MLIDGIPTGELGVEPPVNAQALKHLEGNVEPEVAVRVPASSLCMNAPFAERPVVVVDPWRIAEGPAQLLRPIQGKRDAGEATTPDVVSTEPTLSVPYERRATERLVAVRPGETGIDALPVIRGPLPVAALIR